MIFSVLAFIALVISICIKNRKISLRVQSLNCIFEALYAYTIGAFTGAFLGLFNFIRSSIFIYSEKINKKLYVFLLFIFEAVIIANCIYTWNGAISIFPSVGSIIRTYCLWQKDMKKVRISGVTTAIFYGIYYIYYQSLFLVLGYFVLLLVSMFSIYENDMKSKVKLEKKMVNC